MCTCAHTHTHIYIYIGTEKEINICRMSQYTLDPCDC